MGRPFVTGMQTHYPSSIKQGVKEIVRADEENDSASQPVVEGRRQGTQSALEGSNTRREDRENDEADRRRS